MDKGGQKSGGEPKNPMTKEDAARIQSSYAKQHDGKVDRGSFPARAQAAADKRENKTDNEGGSEQSGEDTKNPMTKEDAARIQSSYAKQHDGKVDKGSFPARAQAAADKRENKSGNEGRTEQAGEDTTNTSGFGTKMDKEGGQKTDGGSKNLMDKEAAARIQRAEAKQHGGGVEKGGFAARAQAAADKPENQKN